jgi:hypothetical protein
MFSKEQIEILKPNSNIEPISIYQKEIVEHLVDQIIKLHNANEREYDQSLVETMAILNQTLKLILTTKLVLK